MAKNYFKSYIWLIETFQSRGHLTLRELQSLWLRSSVNDEQKELAPRTFSNHTKSIEDIFGIEIACDRHDNTYYIRNEDEIGGSGVRNWMLAALSLNSLLNESAGLKDRIIFENVPSSQKYLATVIQAIRDGKVINVTYHSFRKQAPETLVLEPYFLREYKRRWYLYARKGNDNDPHQFALDRISDLKIDETHFSMPKNFSANEYFNGIYGKNKYDKEIPQTVILKASNMQAKYITSLPLHNTHEIVEENEEYTIFKYSFIPDYDFIQDILSFREEVEVLEPECVRDRIKAIISKLDKIYNGRYEY